jgi:RHS repeat-associated core domain
VKLTGNGGVGANPFLFGGQFGYYTDYGNIILCGARWYDPAQGRWLSRDPIGYGGGENLYCFCESNPVGYVDPDGLDYYPGGHHYAPGPVRNYPGLSIEARRHFNKRTTGSVPGHNNAAPHSEYNRNSLKEFEEFIEKHKIDPKEMTEAEAEEFIQTLRHSKNKVIRGLIKDCEEKAAAEALRKAAQLTASKLTAGAERALVKEVEETVGKKVAKKAAGAIGKKLGGPLVSVGFFLYDCRQGGVSHATNQFLWPLSLLWGGK